MSFRLEIHNSCLLTLFEVYEILSAMPLERRSPTR
jgi:hypothetical protein